MSDSLIKFFILWGPTFLFILIVLFGFFKGFLRGFRKSFILFIHMLIALIICSAVYAYMVNSADLDANIVKTVNGVLGNFDKSLQQLLGVSSNNTTIHEMLMEMILSKLSPQQLIYHIVVDDAAYIQTLVEISYRLILFLLVAVLFHLLLVVLYWIYLIFYPVRRKIKAYNKKFRNGEVPHKYKRRRLLGSVVNGFSSFITGIIAFSFLGTLIFIVTGGSEQPDSKELGIEGEITFNNEEYTKYYDYYSYVCEAGDTGIFKFLNGVKDPNQTPYYFYIADMVLQGGFKDDVLNVNGKLILRDEAGTYVKFAKDVVTLLIKYSDGNINKLLDFNSVDYIFELMSKEGFAEELAEIIDAFEAKPYMINLCLKSLTSLINHVELVVKDEKLQGLIKCAFNEKDGIKVTDLATETDVKNLFKGLVSVIANQEPIADSDDGSDNSKSKYLETKQIIGYVKELLPSIQSLSLFETRKDVGNKIVKNLYYYCAENLVESSMELPAVPEDIVWIDEFDILLEASKPLLSITSSIYDANDEILVNNFLHMFDAENSNALQLEADYDEFTSNAVKSQLLNVVLKFSVFGDAIDKVLVDMTKNEEAGIPRNIDYVNADGSGECAVLLKSLKTLLKNGGADLYDIIKNKGEEITVEEITAIFKILKTEVETEDGLGSTTLVNELLNSQLLHYSISSYLTYASLGDFEFYIPHQAAYVLSEQHGDTTKEYKIINKSEIKVIVNTLVECEDLIPELMKEDKSQINISKIFENDKLSIALEESYLLRGTIVSMLIDIIEQPESNVQIILPINYDNPDNWFAEELDQPGEIDYLITAIKQLGQTKDEEGNSLVDVLLKGEIDLNTIIDLNSDVIDSLCQSKVLRYTISDIVTDIKDDNFAIIIPKNALEEEAALTTKEGVTVDVLAASEMKSIFKSVKLIANFQEDNTIKIDYSSLFKNKDEILDSVALQATFIKMLVDMSQGDNAQIIVPTSYVEDYEKIVSGESISGNLWFGSGEEVTDDELYLLLSAIEQLVADENGVVPEDFDLQTDLHDKMQIRKSQISVLTDSKILAATISDAVKEQFPIPTDIYDGTFIDDEELNSLLDKTFVLLNKDTIKISDISNLDVKTLDITEKALKDIKSSQILMATISDFLTNVDSIVIPSEVTSEVALAEGYDKDSIHVIDDVEYDSFVVALYDLLGTDGKVNLNSLDIDNIKISKENELTKSSILSATLSEQITDIEALYVPTTSTENKDTLKNGSIAIINKEELDAMFNGVFALLGKDEITFTDITDSAFKSIKKRAIDTILESNILAATISQEILKLNGTLEIPNIVEESTTFIKKGTSIAKENADKVICSAELKNLFDSLFVTSGTEVESISDEEKELKLDDFELSDITLPTTDEDAKEMLKSIIVSATLSNQLTSGEFLVILKETLVKYSFNEKSSDEEYIDTDELAKMLLAVTKGMNIKNADSMSVSSIEVPESEESISAITASLNIRATISKTVLSQSLVVIGKDIVGAYEEKDYNDKKCIVLTADEISHLIAGIKEVSGDDKSFDKISLNIDTILTKDENERSELLKTIAESAIYRSMLSDILSQTQSASLFGKLPYYKLLQMNTTNGKETLSNGKEYEYQKYESILAGFMFGSMSKSYYYIIQDGETTEFYNSFEMGIVNDKMLFTEDDIIALEKAKTTLPFSK